MKVGKNRVLTLVALLAVVAIVATGCGGGGTSEGTGGGGTTVKIGIGAPLTNGAVALGQGMKRGAGLAITQANESDKAKELGIEFVAVDGDGQGDPKVGVNVANQFASDPALVGVMGHLNSGVSIPSSKVYADKKIVQISPASTNPDLTLAGLANVFRVCTTDAVQGPAGANMAATQLGFKSAFVVDDSTPYGTGLADEFAKEFEAKGGKILGREKTSDKDQDFSGLVTKMKDLNPDLIYYGGIYNAGALLAKQAKEGGMTAPLMGGDGLYDPEFVNIAGKEAAEGDLCTSIGYPVADLPAGQEFVSAYEAAYPGENIAAYDAYSYDAANIIINAVYTAAEKVGADKVTAPEGRDAIIAAVAANDSTGVTGKISFDENGDTTNKVVTLYKVVNGEWASQASVAQ